MVGSTNHVGRLIDGYVSPETFLDPRHESTAPPTYHGQTRPSLVYRFGDFIFLYEPGVALDSLPEQIIAATVTDFDPEWFGWVVTAGGDMWGSEEHLEEALKVANPVRKAAGLPEIDIKDIEALDKPPSSSP
jgi:hypothetical protein